MDRRVAILVSRGDATALRLAGSCALAAAAMGARVQVFLLGEAVRPVVEAEADDVDAPGHALQRAREAGSCQLLACSQSLLDAGLEPGAAAEALDAVVGWATILEWTRDVVERFHF